MQSITYGLLLLIKPTLLVGCTVTDRARPNHSTLNKRNRGPKRSRYMLFIIYSFIYLFINLP